MKCGFMKRDTNDCFLQRHFLITTTGRTDSPRDARSVELVNFHWKLVQRYNFYLIHARIIKNNHAIFIAKGLASQRTLYATLLTNNLKQL